jgi:hypothetical protein
MTRTHRSTTLFFEVPLYEDPVVKDEQGQPKVTRVLTLMLTEEY